MNTFVIIFISNKQHLCNLMHFNLLQLSFEVFAMKNEVSFWRGKKSLAGISKRSGEICMILIHLSQAIIELLFWYKTNRSDKQT